MNRFILFLAIFLTVVKTTIPLPFIPNMNNIWTLGTIIALTYLVLKSKFFCFSRPLMFFLLFATIGIAVTNPDPMFRSWERFVSFTLNIALLSPLITSDEFRKFRESVYSFAKYGLSIILIASFFAYFLGINLADKTHEDTYWAFGGITSQSMILAPCCALCLIDSIWSLLFRDLTKIKKTFFIFQTLAAIWLLLVAGSRGSLIGSLLAIAIVLYYYGNATFIMRGVVVFMIALCLIPSSVVDQATYTIQRKQQSAEFNNSATSSRDEKWNARTAEFIENPIWGVGFTSQTNFTSDDDIAFITSTGGLEPGSSWLSILAMTGLTGFVPLLLFFGGQGKKLWAFCKHDILSVNAFAIWGFFIIHGTIEGWIFYAGNFIFFLFWLSTSHFDNLIHSLDLEKNDDLE